MSQTVRKRRLSGAELDQHIREKAKIAREKTNKELAEELAQHSKLSVADISKLLPKETDKEALAQLVAILNAETANANKIAALKGNIENLGGVVFGLLKHLV